MKRYFFIPLTVLLSVVLSAQVHITIDDPATWTAQALAPYVGQEVIFDSPLTISSNSSSSSLVISPTRLFTANNQALPGSVENSNVVIHNSACSMTLYDMPSRSNDAPYRCGEKIYDLRVKVNSTKSLSWRDWRCVGNTRAELEQGIPDLGDYRLLICAMNLEYYLVANAGYPGPSSYSQHQYQRTKVGKALALINADAYGLVEVELGSEALKEIADDLNNKIPGRSFTQVMDYTKATGTNTKSGFVYDANKLRPVGALQRVTEGPANRKMMQCFEEIATGERFIFSINHFKAKTSGGVGPDADHGQGNYNATRTAEARGVYTMYEAVSYAMNEPDILIMGDLNAYAKEDPIMVFLNHEMIDLHRAFHADSSYSYQFSGLAGYLDHAISNKTLYLQVTGMCGFHINSDENDRYTYDKSSDNTMFRSSDHDPVLVGLKLDSTLSREINPYIYNANYSDSLVFQNMYDLNNPDKKSYFAIYTIDGLPICPVTEIKYTDEMMQQKDKTYTIAADNPNLPKEIKQYLPLPPGLYIIHIYFRNTVMRYKVMVR